MWGSPLTSGGVEPSSGEPAGRDQGGGVVDDDLAAEPVDHRSDLGEDDAECSGCHRAVVALCRQLIEPPVPAVGLYPVVLPLLDGLEKARLLQGGCVEV